jgi:hypothetical protein
MRRREVCIPVPLPMAYLEDSMVERQSFTSAGRRAAVALVVLTASLAGWSCSRSESPTAPSGPAAIALTVAPNAVSYAGGAGVGGPICPAAYPSRWGPFTWTLRETNGRAVSITSFRYLVKTVDGRVESDEEVVRGLSASLTGAATATLALPAYASLSGRPEYDCELERNGRPAFGGGSIEFTASGRDDAGNAVTSTATLTLLPPP